MCMYAYIQLYTTFHNVMSTYLAYSVERFAMILRPVWNPVGAIYSVTVQPALRSTQPHLHEYRVSLTGLNRPGRGVNYSLPSSVEVKENVEIQLFPVWSFIAGCRTNFTFHHDTLWLVNKGKDVWCTGRFLSETTERNSVKVRIEIRNERHWWNLLIASFWFYATLQWSLRLRKQCSPKRWYQNTRCHMLQASNYHNLLYVT
jgi:hypothetical protein